jgi:hypothetical protein
MTLGLYSLLSALGEFPVDYLLGYQTRCLSHHFLQSSTNTLFASYRNPTFTAYRSQANIILHWRSRTYKRHTSVHSGQQRYTMVVLDIARPERARPAYSDIHIGLERRSEDGK